MRLTARLVLLIGTGAPFALVLILVDDALWPGGLLYAIGVLGLMAADFALAPRRRAVNVSLAVPASALIGETAHCRITFDTPPDVAGAGEIVADLNGPTEPAATLPFVLGRDIEIGPDIVPTRRGVIEVERLWVHWHGPLGLARQVKQVVPASDSARGIAATPARRVLRHKDPTGARCRHGVRFHARVRTRHGSPHDRLEALGPPPETGQQRVRDRAQETRDDLT